MKAFTKISKDILSNPVYIIIIDRIPYKVDVFSVNKELKKGYAYIYKHRFVLPFLGMYYKNYDDDDIKPGLYVDSDTNKYLAAMPSNQIVHMYKTDMIKRLEPHNIIDLLESENDIIDVNSDDIAESDVGDIFIPPIHEEDNALMKAIKDIIIRKEINLKDYESRFNSPGDMSNKKATILRTNDLTFNMFDTLCNIFDIEYTIKYKDRKGCKNPMSDPSDEKAYVGIIKNY